MAARPEANLENWKSVLARNIAPIKTQAGKASGVAATPK
jgi:hypothetical protein